MGKLTDRGDKRKEIAKTTTPARLPRADDAQGAEKIVAMRRVEDVGNHGIPVVIEFFPQSRRRLVFQEPEPFV